MQQSDFERRWRQRFSERGAVFNDDAGIAGWTSTGLATRVRQFLRLWRKTQRQPGLWLDVGCGAGTYSRLLRADGHRVVGVDYALPSLVKAKEKNRDSDIAWVSADVQHLPFADGSVDGVLCFGVMQALGTPDRALAELSRVLRPDGELWVDGLNARCVPTLLREWRRRLRGGAPHLRYDHPRRFLDGVRSLGMNVPRLHWLPILPGRLQRFQPVVESAPVYGALAAVPPLGLLLSHSFIVRAVR